MPFALTAVQLEEAMGKPGCPICRLAEDSARKSAEGFLYENALNPGVRQPIIAARGFCPEHTRLLVAVEMSSSGPVLGVNYIYEQLARVVAAELKSKPAPRRWLRSSSQPLPCPLCTLVEQSATNLLQALFEELENSSEKAQGVYAQSDSLCYAHLRQGLAENSRAYPTAARFLTNETLHRLEANSTNMQEYIRKHDWHYRDEPLSPAELNAWKKTLTFFTGLPEEKFNHKIEKR